MKNLLFILALVLIPLWNNAQAASKDQKKRAQVSKYSVRFDKNTKNKILVKSRELADKEEDVSQNTFNYHYSMYLTSSENNKDYSALLKAYQINPTNSELYFELAKYFELKKDKSNKKTFCRKLQATNLNNSLREYAYNTLMSVEQNGILVTYGEDDTYPIWILQTIENIRTDVKVLNYNLLMNASYRDQLTKELNLRFSKSYSSNLSILKDVAQKNSKKKVYYSLTVSHLVLKEFKKKLFATGLALKYSKKNIDNSQILKTNWETKFGKSYITRTTNPSASKKININYLLPLLHLSRYYKENNKMTEYNTVIATIRQIGINAGKQNQVEALLAK